MLVKLPIIKNNNIDIINFILEKFNNKFILRPLKASNDDIFEVLLSNKEFCLNKFVVQFPLQLEILDSKYLLSKFFFVCAVSNGFDCELNFFSNLLKCLNKFDSRLKYYSIDNLKDNVKSILKKINIKIELRKKFETFEDMKLYLDDQLNYSMNLIYLLLYKYYNYNWKDFKDKELTEIIPKKIITCLNILKNFKIKFKGSEEFTISQHLDNLVNKKIESINLKKDSYYFVKFNDSKIIKMKIISNDNNNLTSDDMRHIDRKNCQVFNYNPKYHDHLNFDYFIKEVMKYDFELKTLICSKLLKKNEDDLVKVLQYIYKDNTNYMFLSSLRNLEYTFNNLENEEYNKQEKNLEMKILEDGYFSNDYMLFLSNKYKDNIEKKTKILKILFDKYNFPLTFNKKKLNENFEMIMYFSLLNYQDLIKVVDSDKLYLENFIIDIVPVKLKNLYFNLLKTFYQLNNNSLENISYNFKYYQDYIYIYVVKNIIQDNSIITTLFKNCQIYPKLINVYKKNFILNQLITELEWSKLSEKLNNLLYIYRNNDLIFYQNKLNRNLFSDSVDYKIKGIILDKFSMFKYLKQEKDFIKWTKFLKSYVNELYEKSISLSNDDLEILGKLIYKLFRLQNQNLKDNHYIDLIDFCQKNKKLILVNNRINLMIREKFSGLKCQINLGYFAKHLNFNNVDNKIEIIEDKEINNVKIELKKITKKYYKYKGKYIKSKGNTSSITNFI